MLAKLLMSVTTFICIMDIYLFIMMLFYLCNVKDMYFGQSYM